MSKYNFNKKLTIIITSSFIPSHPSIRIIKETIESLNLVKMQNNTKVILAHDYSEDKNYTEYLDNLNNYIKNLPNFQITKCQKHSHLVGNIRNALLKVNSKYILVIQHDLPFIAEFNINKIIEDIEENKNIKHIRFNKRNNIKKGFEKLNDLFGLQLYQKNYTYTRTPGWSDNNHLCLTSYYNNIIMKECQDGYAMEKILNGRSTNVNEHNKYGTYLFGPLNHHKMIKHTNGRNHNYYSVLKKAKKEDIKNSPFPYLVIKDALDKKLYKKLSKNYPLLEQIFKSKKRSKKKKKLKQNLRLDMNGIDALKSDIDDVWKEFIEYNSSHEFWNEFLNLFKDKIFECYPNIEEMIGSKLEDVKIDLRYKNQKENRFEIDCSIGMNTSVTQKSSVRGPHVDIPNKLFVGLLYFRLKKDDSEGGDLEIYKVKDECKEIYNNNKKLTVNPKSIEKVDTIKYNRNCLVFFLNTKKSIHGVSERSVTNHNRRLFNIIGSFGDKKKFKFF